jgi:lipoate---protein ligase
VTSYELVRTTAGAGELHAREIPAVAVPTIWWHHIASPALVLGSTTDPSVVDTEACARAGVEIVRRRSGGGAVLLVPGEHTWIDVIVPAGAPGWAADVHGPMVWLGRHLAHALDAAPGGGDDTRFDVHEGALVATTWSSLVCFDGLGPGEVLADGIKLVGISQRRTRAAARLQVSWHSSYDPAALPSLLRVEQRPPVDELRPVARLDPIRSAEIPERLAAALP